MPPLWRLSRVRRHQGVIAAAIGRHLLSLATKDLQVSLLNGSIWGVVVGIVAVALYANYALGAVMTSGVC